MLEFGRAVVEKSFPHLASSVDLANAYSSYPGGETGSGGSSSEASEACAALAKLWEAQYPAKEEESGSTCQLLNNLALRGPFDAVHVGFAVPQALAHNLSRLLVPGGRMVAPVTADAPGTGQQEAVAEQGQDHHDVEQRLTVFDAPLVGLAGKKSSADDAVGQWAK